MKKNLSVCLGMLLGMAAAASVTNQFTFLASTLPGQPGDYNCSYYSANNAYVASMLVLATNGVTGAAPPVIGTNVFAQSWDFSQPLQPSETILRTDIIPATNGPDGGYFPLASYAEQDSAISGGATNQTAWRYYSITNVGRDYYGFYEPQSVDADALAQFYDPTVDIPPVVQYGDTWSREVMWGGKAAGEPIDYDFTTTATVDAVGYLTLPSIGTVNALRVHEAQVYKASWYSVLLEDAPCDYYYWLVPRLGVAVQIIVNQADTSGTLTGDNFVERMYYANYFTNVVYTSLPSETLTNFGNLHIQLQSGLIQLNWTAFTNSSSYVVQTNGSLASTNWHTLGSTTGTNWTDTPSPTQRFYRVVGSP